MLRARLHPPRDLFPINPWAVEVVGYPRELSVQLAGQAETAFALANGYLGLRGTHEEDRPREEPGIYLNGFYEYRPIVYGEHAFGFPKVGQTILNCPDGRITRLYVDDWQFDLETAEILAFHRKLDFAAGILIRSVLFETPRGKRVRLETKRLVSFKHRNLAALDYRLVIENGEAELIVSSELINRHPLPVETADPRLGQGFAGRILEPVDTHLDKLRTILSFRTTGSGLMLGCGMEHLVETDCPYSANVRCDNDVASVVFKIRAGSSQAFRMAKFLSYHYADRATPAEIRAQTSWTLDRAVEDGFARVEADQKTFVQGFWQRSDVEVDGEESAKQQVIRWNLFQLLQASARAEGYGIAARGLTGRAYEGHNFWDTEIYVLPFLIYTDPPLARGLLKHRYRQLTKAEARARELGHRGATFPWRTINGDEASAYYAAGTAQYHINADIMYGLRKYVEMTGDVDFLHRYGAEMLVETARFWLDLGGYVQKDGRQFCINGVTGPDEYTAIVNNNFFTNLMAQTNLQFAVETVRMMEHRCSRDYDLLVQRTDLAVDEIAMWQEAADHMCLPRDKKRGIFPQDDSFLDKEVWDFAQTPEDNYPLLLHYHPLNLYRHQVLKQADVILAMFLLGDQFNQDEKKRNFDYYDPLTTHDSSLSVCIQSIIAAEIGYLDKAKEYFDFAATMDVADVGGNMKHGAHIASIGGTWMALAYGFGGLRDQGGKLTFCPKLAPGWTRLKFQLTVRNNLISVEIRSDTTNISAV